MLNKRIMLLVIFLITLFALSAVSASENITDSIAETDEHINWGHGNVLKSLFF